MSALQSDSLAVGNTADETPHNEHLSPGITQSSKVVPLDMCLQQGSQNTYKQCCGAHWLLVSCQSCCS